MKLDRRVLATLVAVVIAGGCSREPPAPQAVATPVPVPTPRILVRDHLAFTAAVDALAAETLEQGPVAGMSIAVFKRGLPVLAKGYGFSDLEAKVPATPETSSRPIAAIGTARLLGQRIIAAGTEPWHEQTTLRATMLDAASGTEPPGDPR